MRQILFQDLKQKLTRRSDEDRDLRELVRRAVKKILPGDPIRDLIFTKQSVVIVAKGKLFAQELFFHKHTIEQEIGKNVLIK